MKKQDLLDIILDLPANMREQLAGEIYQGLDAADPELNASWIVEANHRMWRLEDTPPAIPKEEILDDDHDGNDESVEFPKYDMSRNIFELIDELRLRCDLEVGLNQSKAGMGIPSEEVFREIRERGEQREELLGDLKVPPGPVPDVIAVDLLDDFNLQLTFKGGEQRIFDLKPLRKGIFSELQDPEYFSWVRVHWGGIRWPYGETLYSNILYPNSIPKDE